MIEKLPKKIRISIKNSGAWKRWFASKIIMNLKEDILKLRVEKNNIKNRTRIEFNRNTEIDNEIAMKQGKINYFEELRKTSFWSRVGENIFSHFMIAIISFILGYSVNSITSWFQFALTWVSNF